MSTKSLTRAQGSRSSTAATPLSEKLEKSVTVLILVLATGGLLPLLRSGESGVVAAARQEDPVSQLIWIGAYAAGLALVAVRWRLFLYVATRDKLLLLLTGIAIVSVLWSAAPEVTLRRGFALVCTTVIGIYFAMRYSPGEQLRLLAWALGAVALLSLLVALALPSYGISQGAENVSHAGDWQGVFDHKNTLGSRMALGALVFLLLIMSLRRYRKLAWVGLGLSVGLLLLSGSTSSLFIFIALLVLLPLYSNLRRPYTLAVPLFIFFILLAGAAATLLLVNLEPILLAFGRDVTLTGRVQLWEAVLDMIWERPWLGYGYNAFWLGWDGPSAQIWQGTTFRSVHAHNGLLDTWLTLGLLGVVVLALQFLVSCLRAIIWVRVTRTAEGLWPLAFITFGYLTNVTESRVLNYNSINWIVYVTVCLSLFLSLNRNVKTRRSDQYKAE